MQKSTTIFNLLRNTLKENKRVLLFVFAMLAFRTSYADWNVVPTESMLPTIVVGDRILVNKTAYDVFIPFTHKSVHKRAEPQRGDIIVFNSKAADLRLVKRVIGISGDKVEMRNNRLSINDSPLAYTNQDYQTKQMNKSAYKRNQFNQRKDDLNEYLTESPHTIRVKPQGSRLSSFRSTTVPEGHFLVMGDNRDNSADSRVFGFVPREEILGKAESVVMSLDYDDYYKPRAGRFFKKFN